MLRNRSINQSHAENYLNRNYYDRDIHTKAEDRKRVASAFMNRRPQQ